MACYFKNSPFSNTRGERSKISRQNAQAFDKTKMIGDTWKDHRAMCKSWWTAMPNKRSARSCAVCQPSHRHVITSQMPSTFSLHNGFPVRRIWQTESSFSFWLIQGLFGRPLKLAFVLGEEVVLLVILQLDKDSPRKLGWLIYHIVYFFIYKKRFFNIRRQHFK